jgi:hypothetical protein
MTISNCGAQLVNALLQVELFHDLIELVERKYSGCEWFYPRSE